MTMTGNMIRLGISTCPNDTFAFHGLLTGAIDRQGLEFQVDLLDVQELNVRLQAGHYDVAKASFFAALLLGEDYVVMPCGAALGFGVGPLLLSRHAGGRPDDATAVAGRSPIVLCPGELTTATLLYRIFFPGAGTIRQTVFSAIMPALQRGEADFGVCIHEGRFTWSKSGLHCVADLGELWEQRTQLPLPLGGILAARRLGNERLSRVLQVIRDSIDFGLAHRQQTFPTMRQYALELDDQVIMAHVDLYVNDQTRWMEQLGRRALDELWTRAVSSGAAPASTRAPQVFEP